MRWHVEQRMLERFAAGTIDVAHAFSVETHLIECADCRTRMGRVVERERLEAVWAKIDDVVVAPARGPIEGFMLKVGVPDHIARVLTATPSLRLSWFLAVAAVLGIGVATAHASDRGFIFFLVVAPLLPLAGVALAYGPGVDPTYEIGIASPLRSFELLLIRAAAVLVATMVLGGLAALALPRLDWTATAWLLPSLALVTASLALSTLIPPLRASMAVGVGWLVVTSVGIWSSLGTAQSMFGESIQLGVLVVTLVSASILYLRRDEFERGDHA
jgi:hypothetical protein